MERYKREIIMETYEKKYKEANDKIAARFGINVAKEIFTDLYESEDEKIRKEIINIFHSLVDGKIPVPINFADIFTWLEKQGEKNPTDEEMKTILRTEYEKGRADAIAEMEKPTWRVENMSNVKEDNYESKNYKY